MRLLPQALAIALMAATAGGASARGPGLGPSAVATPRFESPDLSRPATRLLRGRIGEPLTPPTTSGVEEIARAFVAAELAPPGELVTRRIVEGAGGVRFVTLEQRFDGLPVAMGRVTVAIAQDGSVRAAMVGSLASAAPRPAMAGVVAPDWARATAARAAGLAPQQASELESEEVIVATARGAERATRVKLAAGRPDQQLDVLIGEDGRPLRVEPATFPAVVGARVVPQDPPRGLAMRAFAEPRANPSHDSPIGWSYDVETRGNNTVVQLDREADFDTTAGRMAQATGDPLVFDFPYTGDPAVDVDLALANVFWAINDAHDRFRRLGFDEASGACQESSLARGGFGGDHVHALVQYDFDGTTTNYEAVQMGVGGDGGYTWLAVGVFEDANGVLRDGALETDLLYHELAHAATVRLVGDDGACHQGAHPQALLEGWGDFYAASFTDDPVIGEFTSGMPTGQRFAPVGQSNLSFENLCTDGACDRFVDGLIWADLLWDIRQALRRNLGPAEGTKLAEKLVLEGMRYTPCRPTFLDARDGLLLAEQAVSRGAWHCELWNHFVNRGLGYSASSSGPDDLNPAAAYDLAPECAGSATLAFDRLEYATDDDLVVDLLDATPPPGASVTLTSSSGDTLTLPMRTLAGPVMRAGARVTGGVADPADAVLQVAAGDTIEARLGALVATAAVSNAMDVRILEHHVWGSWCQVQADDDYQNRWYNMPGFLDAGETATIEVALGNRGNRALEDLRFSVTSLSPTVRVLPSTPVPVGTIRPMTGMQPFRFMISFRAEALPTAVAGERATIRIDLESRGRRTSLDLPLELNMDYVEETGFTPFANGVETFDPATSSTWSQWTTLTPRGSVNEWATESCSGSADPWGWAVSQPGCADYVDGQVTAALLSPPILALPPDAVGFAITDWSFDVDSRLGRDLANGFCDADFVGLFLVSDPAEVDYSINDFIYYGSAHRYWRPIYEDTGGFATQEPFYLDRGPRMITPSPALAQTRMEWAFWGNVYDCGTLYPNTGAFQLDDVRFRYDVLRKVPETTPCSADCILTALLVADPPGPKCPGEPFMLRATPSESINCAGPIHYGFSGNGVPPESGWTTDPFSTALGEDGGYYALYASCDSVPNCDDYHQFMNTSPALPSEGYVFEDSLRLRRQGADVVLDWRGFAVPPSYAILRATNRAELEAGPLTWTLFGRQDVEGPQGAAVFAHDDGALEAGISYYVVLARDRCSDALRP